MSKATKALGLDSALEAFKKVGEFFGIGETVVDSLTEVADEMDKSGKEWAINTLSGWYEGTPWMTENLKDSLDYDADCPTYTVGVSLADLLGPKVLPAKRVPRYGNITIPGYDYTEEADENAVSGFGSGFIEGLWFEVAKREARKEFGS